MKYVFLFIALPFFSISTGQVLSPALANFLPSTSSNPDLISTLSTADNSGNTYICGLASSPTYYNVVHGNLLLKKFTYSNNVAYSQQLLGDLHVYAMVSDGTNTYIALNYLTQLDYETLHLSSATMKEHPVLLKLDSAGHYLWHLDLSGNQVTRLRALTLDQNNNIYIGYDNYLNSYIKKIQPNGTILFTLLQENVKMISTISVDLQGNMAVAGGCSESNLQFNGTSASNSLLYSTYIAYYNANQQLQWVHFTEDITCSDPDVVIDPMGNVYFTAPLNGNFSVLGQTTQGPLGGEDFFLVKMNPQGNVVWLREVPGSGQFRLSKKKSLAVSSAQNYPSVIYLAGTTRNLVQWLPNFSTNPGNQDDILLLAYDLNGTIIHYNIGGSTSGNDRLDAIAINSNGAIATISGITTGTGTMQAMPINASSTGYSPFVITLSQVFLNQLDFETTVWSIAPNPAHDQLTIHCEQFTGEGKLYTLLGQILKSFEINAPDTTVSIADLPKGVYLISLGSNTKRIVVD
jgi:hypothetical protein